MIEIIVRQQDGNLGFSTSHQGILDGTKTYEGAVGAIPLLRKTLMEYCDMLERRRDKLIEELGRVMDNEFLGNELRQMASEEYERQVVAREEDKKLALQLKTMEREEVQTT